MKVLVYDGDCSICIAASRVLIRPWLSGDSEREPFDAFEGETAARLVEAEIHNELAVLDRGSGEIRGGLDGILWILREGRLRWVAAILALPGIYHLFSFLYHLIAYNRRILSPVKPRAVACACDPDPNALYQWSFIAICLMLTSLWWLPATGSFAHVYVPVLCCSICLLAAMDFLALLRNREVPVTTTAVIGHLAWIMLLSVIPLYVVALIDPTVPWFAGGAFPNLFLYMLAVFLGFTTTGFLVARRGAIIGFHLGWMCMTPLVLWGAAFFSIRLTGWVLSHTL